MRYGDDVFVYRLTDTRSYNFYLDEVLNIRNDVREKELQKRGLEARLLTRDELLTRHAHPPLE